MKKQPLPVLAVNVEGAAQMLSISVRSVRELIKNGQLPVVTIGRRQIITIKTLETFIETDHPVIFQDRPTKQENPAHE